MGLWQRADSGSVPYGELLQVQPLPSGKSRLPGPHHQPKRRCRGRDVPHQGCYSAGHRGMPMISLSRAKRRVKHDLSSGKLGQAPHEAKGRIPDVIGSASKLETIGSGCGRASCMLGAGRSTSVQLLIHRRSDWCCP